jgi:2-desacetyl-2-hydroxyethyl bacteriochlorophyllide A dehydrogenase
MSGGNKRMMRAVKLVGPKILELVETQSPSSDGENVIIKVHTCGICGSDLHYWETGLDMCGATDLIMGHEFCGTVMDPGNRSDISDGDRVTALPLDPCGTCGPCSKGNPNLCNRGMKRSIPGNNSPGAYAQYLKLRPDMVRKLPDTITDIEAAMIEPASVALHTIHQAGLKAGEKVLITGAGAIGLLCAQWARISGASYIALSEPNPNRRAFAREVADVDTVFDAGDTELIPRMKKEIHGGFDVAIESSASDAGINTLVSALRPRGRIVLAGINFHPQTIFTLLMVIKELEQKTAMGYLPEEFDTALDFIARKKLHVENFIKRTICLEDVQKSFEELAAGSSADVKIIIQVA